MSYPDPNNPYGQQQPNAGQPYPKYPGGGDQIYPGGYPGGPAAVPTTMPGKVTAARIMMIVAGGLQGTLALLLAIASTNDDFQEGFSDGAGYDVPTTALVVVSVAYLIHAVIGIVLGVMATNGGNGIRVGGIVWASFVILFGLIAIPLGVLWIALGIVCIVMLAAGESGAWFKRHQSSGGGGISGI